MKLESCFDGDNLIVTPSGDIDHHEAVELREKIDKLLKSDKPKKLSLNLSKTDFMDSSGLGLILGRYRKACEMGCEFAALDPTPGVLRILELAGADRLITIERTNQK